MESNDHQDGNKASGLLRFASVPSSFSSFFCTDEFTSGSFNSQEDILDFDECFFSKTSRNQAPSLGLNDSTNYESTISSSSLFFSPNQNVESGISSSMIADRTNVSNVSHLARHTSLPTDFDLESDFQHGVAMRILEVGECSALMTRVPESGDTCGDSVRRGRESENMDCGELTRLLGDHLSWQNTSVMRLQDTAPFKPRAKRGCATHPRSIAERYRRTRISERLKKLQELVPNMDKQTTTADTLDLAVEYIKDLQRQVKELTDHQYKCICFHES